MDKRSLGIGAMGMVMMLMVVVMLERGNGGRKVMVVGRERNRGSCGW